MSKEFDFIKNLNKDMKMWKIFVRVIGSWLVTGTNGQSHVKMVIVARKVNIT
jgi:hypothetical protein